MHKTIQPSLMLVEIPIGAGQHLERLKITCQSLRFQRRVMTINAVGKLSKWLGGVRLIQSTPQSAVSF
jgi:hypothetical protein